MPERHGRQPRCGVQPNHACMPSCRWTGTVHPLQVCACTWQVQMETETAIASRRATQPPSGSIRNSRLLALYSSAIALQPSIRLRERLSWRQHSPGCLQVLRLWPAGSRQTPEDCRSAAIYMSCVRTAQEGQGLALCLCQPWNCPKESQRPVQTRRSFCTSFHHTMPLCCGLPQRRQGLCSHHSFKAEGTCAANLLSCRLAAGRCQRDAVCPATPEHPQHPRRHHALQGLPLLLAPQLQHCMGRGGLL